MPTYVYACKNCGHRFEQHQSFTDDALTTCPACGQDALRKVYDSVGVVFKGPGFYSTDSAAKAQKGSGDAGSHESGDTDSSSEKNDKKKGNGSESTGAGHAAPSGTGSTSTGSAGTGSGGAGSGHADSTSTS